MAKSMDNIENLVERRDSKIMQKCYEEAQKQMPNASTRQILSASKVLYTGGELKKKRMYD